MDSLEKYGSNIGWHQNQKELRYLTKRKKMDSNLIPLAEFLTSKEFLRINIPIYQRAYSWEIKHLDQFLDDIDLHLNSIPQEDYQFLGMVVYVEKENKKEIEIIDGQQRVTTFYLMSSIIFDWVKHERRRG